MTDLAFKVGDRVVRTAWPRLGAEATVIGVYPNYHMSYLLQFDGIPDPPNYSKLSRKSLISTPASAGARFRSRIRSSQA